MAGGTEEEEEYVLYVGYDRADPTRSRFCPGSRRAIEIIDNEDLPARVTVQSVDALRETMATLPDWLRGTPTLVSRKSRTAMRGTAAIEHLQEVARSRGAAGDRTDGGDRMDGGGSGPAAHSLDGMVAAGEMAFLGAESNFEPLQEDDPSKYDDSRKVTDNDLQRLLERRKASVPPPP